MEDKPPSSPIEMPPVMRPRSRIRLSAGGWLGGGVLVIMLLACLVSMPYTFGRATMVDETGQRVDRNERRYEATELERTLLPPTWAPHRPDERERLDHAASDSGGRPWTLFGTDRLGRDLLVRTLAGGGISLLIGVAAAGIAVTIGTLYGAIAGYAGGRIDAVMMRFVDVLYGLPYILLVVLLAVAIEGVIDRFGGELAQGTRQSLNVLTLLIAIGGVSWLTMARVIRGQVLSLKSQPFMEACRAMGVPLPAQFIRHLLPNLIGPIVVYATLTVPQAILQESFLSFLGIGVQAPLPSWGNLAAEGLTELNTVRIRWWLLFWPCALLGLTLLSLNFVGEALREAFDPRGQSGR